MAGEGIVLRSSEDPRPGPNEILPRVRASSLNYRDLMVLKGGGRGPTKLGVMPLSDGAGEVAAIGEGVTLVKVGDRVIGTFHPRWFGGPLSADYLTDRLGANLDGMLAEYAVLSEEALVPVPSHLSFEEAATLPCAAVTAWAALAGHRRVTAGDTVLTQGSGGVSVFALQFARVLGARVIATTSTAEKAERLNVLGASEVINYTETPDWDVKARELTDGRGVDCVVEIGGPGTIAKSLKALAVGGHLSLIGASLSPSGAMLDPLLLAGRGITVGAINVGSRADFEAMNRTIAQHRLRAVIDRTFPFAEANAASPFRRPQPFRQGRDHTRMSGSVSRPAGQRWRGTYSIYWPATDPVWLDVITVPAGASVNGQVAPGRARIRHQFVDFTGTYVLHCHILAHEGRGMMQLVRLVDAEIPGFLPDYLPEHH